MSDSDTDTAFLIQNLVKKYSPQEEEKVVEVPLEQDEETPAKKIRKRAESSKVNSHLLKARPIAIQKRKEYAQARREAKEIAEKNKYVSDLKKVAIEEMKKIKEEKRKMEEEMKKKEIEEIEDKVSDDTEQTEEEEELPVPKKTKKRVKTPIPKKIKMHKKVQVKVKKQEGKKKRVIRASDLETSSENESSEDESEEIVIVKRARSGVERKRDFVPRRNERGTIIKEAPKKKKVTHKEEQDWFNDDGYYF
jgi:hypothetical protein